MKETEDTNTKNKEKIKSFKGITLIALVVTIVVLIVLATISINIIFGEEGILERAKKASYDMANAQEEEKEILAEASNSIDGYVVGERENINSTSLIYPDYENRETLTFTNGSHTIENDGYVQMDFYYTAGVSSLTNDNMYINGIRVFRNHCNYTWGNVMSPLLLVKEGDVITYTATAQNITLLYYPFR